VTHPPPIQPQNLPRVAPRIEIEDAAAGRLAPDMLRVEEPGASQNGWGTLGLAGFGAAILLVGFAGLEIANFVADQFARSAWLGWITLAIAASGVGVIGAAIGQEFRFLRRLAHVDHLRAALADPGQAQHAAQSWVRRLPRHHDILPALAATSDPEAVLALLRGGPGVALSADATRLGRIAAVQVLAITAAIPAPALDGVIVGLRGLRLVREVASLYGLRPSTLGTIALLRRSLVSAIYVSGANVAVDTVVKAAISNPALQHLAGDVADAAVAARRMIVLARATAAACSPLA
jgi:uncharacterized membrane protein YcjF (UPF0283 family)